MFISKTGLIVWLQKEMILIIYSGEGENQPIWAVISLASLINQRLSITISHNIIIVFKKNQKIFNLVYCPN